MNGTQVLPFRGSHFRTRLRGARGVFGEKGNDEVIHFHGQEATEFVEPQRPLDALGRLRELHGDFASNRDHSTGMCGFREIVV